jgi:aspartyl-tRNA(Asn)/glutamyl-tRNA(Gln) amidotransferase subunit A
MQTDLLATRARLRQGQTSATDELGAARRRRRLAGCEHVFLATRFEAAERRRGAPARTLPLAGLPVSVKDLFDCAGEVTAAGSTACWPTRARAGR